jgi:hypothetical protein
MLLLKSIEVLLLLRRHLSLILKATHHLMLLSDDLAALHHQLRMLLLLHVEHLLSILRVLLGLLYREVSRLRLDINVQLLLSGRLGLSL